jgi:hypothetical protein
LKLLRKGADMLWYAAWRDTRWWFLIGLGLLSAVALANTLTYPYWHSALAAGIGDNSSHAVSSMIRDSSSFRGYVWVQLVQVNLSYLWILLAVVRGSFGPFYRRSGALFALALPVSRRRIFAVGTATAIGELVVLALAPLLLVPAAALVIGYDYPLLDVFVYGAQIAGGGAVFYCLPLWLATVYDDRWRPILITCATAVLGSIFTKFIPAWSALNPGAVAEGERYFRTGAPGWSGVLIWLAASAVLLYAALRTLEARDF